MNKKKIRDQNQYNPITADYDYAVVNAELQVTITIK